MQVLLDYALVFHVPDLVQGKDLRKCSRKLKEILPEKLNKNVFCMFYWACTKLRPRKMLYFFSTCSWSSQFQLLYAFQHTWVTTFLKSVSHLYPKLHICGQYMHVHEWAAEKWGTNLPYNVGLVQKMGRLENVSCRFTMNNTRIVNYPKIIFTWSYL